MARLWPFKRGERAPVTEAIPVQDPTPPRAGFEYGIPPHGITASSVRTRTTGADAEDRTQLLTDLYDAFLACNWSWTAATAIARAITAGGLVFRWDQDDSEGDQEEPDKPVQVLQCERLLKFTNPREDIIQLLRSTVLDLLVFGDAYIEIVWAAGIPVALYTLDVPSTSPIVDTHGDVTGYMQVTEQGQEATFEPHEVIHVSLDAPRSGIFGVSPTFAAMLPIKIWLFASAVLKELFRKGLPPSLHVDHPANMDDKAQKTWRDKYMAENLGPLNMGRPVMTKGGGSVKELQHHRIVEILHVLDQQRDAILSTYGVPPAEAGVIESGNLGGGTGESQHRMFMVNTCAPIAALILEKINYVLLQAFGITGWHLEFEQVDMRDSEVIERIRDMRLKNGSWTLNRYRTEIDEPPVDGGDNAVLMERNQVVLWRDMEAASNAAIAAQAANTALEPDPDFKHGDPMELAAVPPAPVPDVLAPFAGTANPPAPPGGPQPDEEPAPAAASGGPKPPTPPQQDDKEGWRRPRRTRESWAAYRARIREAMAELPHADRDRRAA